MKLLIISDLHFKEKNDWEFIYNITEKMVLRLKNKITENEDLIIIVLGDIIHCGGNGDNAVKFCEADKFVKILKRAFNNIKFLFIPGNHEILRHSFELTPFNEFCKRHSYKKDFVFTMDKSVFSVEEAGLNLILVDSTLTRNHDLEGKINIDLLKAKMSKRKNIIFMHHPPCEKEGADRHINNSAELIDTHSNFIFYGHQHGGVKVPDFLEMDTDIHSVGTLLGQGSDCSNEFILLDVAEGKINYAYRYKWAATNFIPKLLFPAKKNIISDHLAIGKPDKIGTSITRNVKRIINHSDVNNDKSSLWNDYIGEDIDTVVAKNNLLIIVGDAGIGKSFELANIYWQYEGREDFYTILVNLRNTKYEDVVKYLGYAKHNTIDNKIPLLIIDGLDEMDGSKLSDLIKEIGSAINGNIEAKIILSTRTNFKVEVDNKFAQYQIQPLTNEHIATIASKNGIHDTLNFLKCINSSNCLSLAQSPFYLFGMISLFREAGALPKREQLLDKMISLRFKKGDERNPCSDKETLMANEYDLRCAFQEMSFLMQALHEYSLDNKRYTQYFTSSIRELFNKSGLVLRKENENTSQWEFEHNNFREFFVADYLKSISFEQLLCIITCDDKKVKLRPTWVNIVSFLVLMRKDDELINWLIENAPETIYQYDSDRIKEEDRNKIFIRLMQDSFAKNVPIYAIHHEEELAKYFQSEVTVNFIFQSLISGTNTSAILSLLSILRCFDNVYDKEHELKEAIMPFINTGQPEYVVAIGIKALELIFRNNLPTVLDEVFILLKDDERSEVIGAICKLIVKANVSDEYFDYIFSHFNKFEQLHENYSIWKSFSDAFKSFKKPENIIKSIEFLCSDKAHQFFRGNELFQELLVILFDMNKSGNNSLLNAIANIFAHTSGKCDWHKSKLVKQLFSDNQMLPDAFKQLLKMKTSTIKMMFSIEAIMEESLVDILVSSYMNNEVDGEAYKWYATRLPSDSPIFKKLNSTVLEKEGVEVQRAPVIDWEGNRRKGTQRYFDSLFDKAQFSILIKELLAFVGDEITCKQLLSATFSKVPHDREDMQNIRAALYHSGNENCKAINFLDNVDWCEFSISEVCEVLISHEEVEVSTEQEQVIREYFDITIANVNFETLLSTEFFKAKRIILFLNKFNFNICDEKLLEMLMLPWHVFASSSSSGESKALQFVTEKIMDTKKLQDKILGNIKYKKLSPLFAQTHLLYCIEYNLPDAVDIAIDLFYCELNKAKYHKNTAVDYLIKIKGNKFVDNLVSKISDYDLLVYISHCMKNDNTNLIEKMVAENKKAESKTLFLEELLEQNNRYALETYLKLAIEANGLPDLYSDSSIGCDATRAIRNISDISQIDLISKLFELCCSEGFVDREHFGLRDALDSVINNLAQVDKFCIKEMLTNLVEQSPNNKKLLSTCHMHLENIDRLINISSDSPWSIEATLEFLQSRQSERILQNL